MQPHMFTNWTGPMSSQQSRTDVSEIRSPKHPLFLGITFFSLLPDLKVQFATVIASVCMEAFKVEASVS